MEKEKYYLGLDVGTDSVGYAVTDTQYALKKFRGEPMWGVHLFEEAQLNDERRAFRTARRRLDRRQQRIRLLQELFAQEIEKKDARFFIRIKESALFPEDSKHGVSLFADKEYRDADYHKQYPTIHHLIMDLIENPAPHDVRLVYLACAWLCAHRGHFLSEISKDNLGELLDVRTAYREFMDCFEEDKPWEFEDATAFGEVLKKKLSITKKYRELSLLLFNAPKVPKTGGAVPDREALLKLLCGSKVSPKQLFANEEYVELDSFSLDKGDEELEPILGALGEDATVVMKAKALFDWAVLSDILQGGTFVSRAKTEVYRQHKSDLFRLKYLLRKYDRKAYYAMFRQQDSKKVNYETYAKGNSGNHEEFCKYAKMLLKDIDPEEADRDILQELTERAESGTLCPKQVSGDNRVIPYQVYWAELKAVLDNAACYLPFLRQEEDGITVAQKILSIFEFRIPYFVGPLNPASRYAWIRRKADGKIYPWNFEQKVDLEASEQAFIDRMTATCTYLPDADVLPKMSLCYEAFMLLNEINALSVGGRRVPVQVKQLLFDELFATRKKVTKKAVRNFLVSRNLCRAEEAETLSGIDDVVKSSLSSRMAFCRLLEKGCLTEHDAERIIERRTYTESKYRFMQWLTREYPSLSEADRAYIGTLRFKDFGRLSRKLLCELYGTARDSATGEAMTVLERMWAENVTLMEVLSEKYTYAEQIDDLRNAYYDQNAVSMDKRLQEMYVSNAVKRPILRALDIVSDVVKANGRAPEKIFIEMARGGKPEEKGKRTKSRLEQIRELYSVCNDKDVRLLSEELTQMGDAAESRLQSDRLFLYYMQLGKCMYTGQPIELSQLAGKTYDIDHIYPQSKVKDDSVHNNKVLVLSMANGEKGDVYPIKAEIRHAMRGWWDYLQKCGLITAEKYRRLTRGEAFSEEEMWGFINRQLVETRQSTKALATVLGERYPHTEIVYVKAGLVSEFRQEFDMLKSRAVNDLHHAKDAYLNIVVGQVYHTRFTRNWFLAHRNDYNVKVKTLFTHEVTDKNGTVVWDGVPMLAAVKNIVRKKNAIHLTRYAFCRKGGLFDQQPAKAAAGLIPLKKGLPTEKYGGYNKTTATFFMFVGFTAGKKSDVMLMPVELLAADRVLADTAFAEEYSKQTVSSIIGKEVQSVAFPLGMRPVKIGTVFEFDGGYRAYLTGKANAGRVVGLSTFMPLVLGYSWETYIKRLEKMTDKAKANPGFVYSAQYDGVTREDNHALYAVLLDKLKSSCYRQCPANPAETLQAGEHRFAQLDVIEQAKCLLQIVMVFNRISGSDLTAIGGVSKAAVTTLSSALSNWKKKYTDVRLVDMSASGLHQHRSDNLLELL